MLFRVKREVADIFTPFLPVCRTFVSGYGLGGVMGWLRIYVSFLDDPKVQRLRSREFKRLFLEVLRGEQNLLSEHIRLDSGRVLSREWTEIRSQIFRRDDYTCRYCGTRGGRLECDHVIPVSRGGPTVESNLVTACFKCNRSKLAKTLDEWRGCAFQR
jgi:hypothetical protein